MRLTPSDPDIQTLVTRMREGIIDLQPDFQRGEIWSTAKKQRLIDSILRDWHIPPVHLIIDKKSSRQLVLDGQQRLAAIRDFADSKLTVNGHIEPLADELFNIDECRFETLPSYWKEKFNQFTIRVFRITDYLPSEPGELFYRLNQLSSLTPAEQRNAFFGEARYQIKELVQEMMRLGLDEAFWGFNNVRMAYDDIVARSCLALEMGTLRKRVSSLALADKYRSGEPFSMVAIQQIKTAFGCLESALPYIDRQYKLNKATAQSWLVFLATAANYSIPLIQDPIQLSSFYNEFNNRINQLKYNRFRDITPFIQDSSPWNLPDHFYQTFLDRSTSRVADTVSVILRDFILWTALYRHCELKNPELLSHKYIESFNYIKHYYNEFETSRDLEQFVSHSGWGDQL